MNSNMLQLWKERTYRTILSSTQKGQSKLRKNHKKKKTYVACEDNDIEFSDGEEEKVNTCLMKKHQDDEITSQFLDHDLFRLCKKLTKETNKLDKIIDASQDIISSLGSKNKTLKK